MSVLFKRRILKSAAVEGWRNRLRARRMQDMLRLVSPPSGARVIDLGGTWPIWELIPNDFMITLVNPSPWPCVPERLADRIQIVVADACDLGDLFSSDGFDLAFSNSAIEHVGGRTRRSLFANEVKRLAPSWWVQTPNPRFPVEAHTGLPYYWQWPEWARTLAAKSRRRRMPEWQDEMASTEPVALEELIDLFPT